ncbi:MAG: adenosylcobinamide-phosphate synthase [Actinomycetota bacterium]|nr:adenosylcobinamide-phosphate synthase [Actinomycetota bacterium]
MFEIPAALVLGWLTDRAAGDPARCHPVAGFGRLAGGLEARVWRPCRLAGTVYAGALVGAAGVVTALPWRLTVGRPLGRLALGSAVVWTALGGRSLERAALDLAATLERGDVPAARALLPALAGRDPTALGATELCRAGIESVAENTADAVTGPLLWGALAGPGGVAVYRAANTLDAMVGHRSERYERFGWAAARLDDLLTWPAARLAAGLAVVLAPVADGDPVRAWTVLRRDGSLHPSPNAGRLEAAFAGALGVGLGGVNVYGGRVEARPRMGADAGREPGPEDLRRAVRLSRAAGWASCAVCAALALALALAKVRRKSVAIGTKSSSPWRATAGRRL